MYSIIGTIRVRIMGMTKSEKKVGQFILDNIASCLDMNLSEIACRSGVSDATVSRFCKSIGCRDFSDFRLRLAEGSNEREGLSIDLGIDKDTLFEEIPVKVIERSVQGLRDCMEHFDMKCYLQALEAIKKADMIYIFGVANSASIADDMMNKFARIGLKVCVVNDAHLQIMISNAMRKTDLAIGISHAGETEQTVSALQLAQKVGAKTICITANENSSLAKVSDICLLTAGFEQDFTSETMTSRLSQLAVVDMLYLGIICSDFDTNMRLLESQNNELKKYRMR